MDKIFYNIDEFLEAVNTAPKIHKNNGSYKHFYCSFDIETTRGKNGTYMYMFQFDYLDKDDNHHTYIGRQWKDLVYLLQGISFIMNNKKIICLVHNLSYEWQWLKHIISIAKDKNGVPKIFALDKRKIVKVETTYNIEFRCSYILSNSSLAKLAKDFTKTQKLSGEEFDYSKQRNSITPLSDHEIQYGVNDVRILTEYAKYIFNSFNPIPLTATGFVRNDLKASFNEMDKSAQKEWRKIINRCFPSEEQYATWITWLYCGGYVHADYEYTGQILEEIMASFDFKSSYISVLFENFPYQFYKAIPSIDEVNYIAQNNERLGFIAEMTIDNICITTPHSIFSKHKIITHHNAIFDNGRLVKADQITILLNELDYLNLLDFYKFSNITITGLRVADKKPLPKFFLDMVNKYFALKESTPKDTADYMQIKNKLNALYGMCVTKLTKEELVFNGYELVDSGEELDWWKVKSKQLLLPQFGIWVASYSRRNLLSLVKEFGRDNVYSDTDSSKLRNYEAHLPAIEEYNAKILARNRRLEAEYGYNLGELGTFQFEEEMTKFKTLGCKRYIADYNGKTHCTISGIGKNTLIDYCNKRGLDIYEAFNDNLYIPPAESGRLYSDYQDDIASEYITDEYGNTELMQSMSCVNLRESPFNMRLDTDYLALVLGQKKYY